MPNTGKNTELQPRRNPATESSQKKSTSYSISRNAALRHLGRHQVYLGLTLIASTAFGVYLLATDKSLWLLAVSHAYGLIVICAIDVMLALLNLESVRKAFLPTMGWASFTILLQIGDITTAPQYKMTVGYFAHYLFGLWAYDAILLTQGIVIALVLSGWKYHKMVMRKKKAISYFDMGVKSSRRDFLQIGGTIGIFVAVAAALGIWSSLSQSPAPQTSSQTTQSSGSGGITTSAHLPSGAIANVNDLNPGVPKYFDYPSQGYTNMLMKRSNGSVYAISILCTHVCCQCQYDSSTTDLYCPCHGSVFDLNGNVVNGPATVKLPSIELNVDGSGNIFPVKVVGSGPCVSGS